MPSVPVPPAPAPGPAGPDPALVGALMPRLVRCLERSAGTYFDDAMTRAVDRSEQWVTEIERGFAQPTRREAATGAAFLPRSPDRALDLAAARLALKSLRGAFRQHREDAASLEPEILESVAPSMATQGMLTDMKAIDAAIAAGMAQLSPRDAAVLRLHYFEGESYDAIAERLGVPVTTVTNWLHRARHALKHELGSAGKEYYETHRARRDGEFWGGDEYEFVVPSETTTGATPTFKVTTAGFFWHADGFVRADLHVPANWPTQAIGMLLSAVDGKPPLASAPCFLQRVGDSAAVAAFLGEPPQHVVMRGPLALPLPGVTLLLAH